MTDSDEFKLKVLLHESEQLDGTIARTVTTANTLFGVVLPIVLGFLVYTANATDVRIPVDMLAFSLAAIVSLVSIYNAGLWVVITGFLRYKYLILYPRLYELGAMIGYENSGQFLAREHKVRGLWPMGAFHLLAAVFTALLSIGGIVRYATGATRVLLLLVAGGFMATAAAVSLWSARVIESTFSEIATSYPSHRSRGQPAGGSAA